MNKIEYFVGGVFALFLVVAFLLTAIRPHITVDKLSKQAGLITFGIVITGGAAKYFLFDKRD